MCQIFMSQVDMEEVFMLQVDIGKSELNAGCPDFGVKGGGDSEDQIREPWMMLAFKAVLSSIAQ